MRRLKIDGIPALVAAPSSAADGIHLHMPAFSQGKDRTEDILKAVAAKGRIAVSFDPFQQGERAFEDPKEHFARVFSNFRRHMWPIIGQTVLEIPRVLDWVEQEYGPRLPVTASGLSMGGDIVIAAAGIDHRLETVVAMIATPDWSRPGMCALDDPHREIDQGRPDHYARFFRDHLEPRTHLERYRHRPRLHFICGAEDTHVPADGALRFRDRLIEEDPKQANRVTVDLLADCDHSTFKDTSVWWPRAEATIFSND